MKLRVYDWNKCDPNESHMVHIEDMDAGIGYMLRRMQGLINHLQKAIENKIVLKGIPEFKVSDWFDKETFQHKKLYNIIQGYIELGTDFESEARKLDRLRELRNYYVHDFPFDYLENNDVLQSKFNDLRKFIKSISTVENSVINSINKSARAIKVKNNVQKEDAKKKSGSSVGSNDNKNRSKVVDILLKSGLKKNQWYTLAEIGNVLNKHNFDYGSGLKNYMTSCGFKLNSQNGKVWSMKF